jgi:glycosyltransferase involved in cell wall biosynthesis
MLTTLNSAHDSSLKLGYVTPVLAYSIEGNLYMQAASGRVADELARRYDKVYVCARVLFERPPAPGDSPLQSSNIELIAQPYWQSTAASLLGIFGISRAYLQTCRRADVLLVRGMCPYIAILYFLAFLFRRPICHWIVGNPVAVLHSGTRKGKCLDGFALCYALQDRAFSRLGRWLTDGSFVCNGEELAQVYRSRRTTSAVSSTIQEWEFFVRTDTCLNEKVRILFVGYIRPEKGIEYLLEAVSRLDSKISWELEIVGPGQFAKYRQDLEQLAASLCIADRVHWAGYVSYGAPLFERMRAADIFVLPTLSEGTPHVLVEARAQGLPCISTVVGGVPNTVRHGYDALLVTPRNSTALSRAMERIVRDAKLRQGLIRNGCAAARKQTLHRFVNTVCRELESQAKTAGTAVPQA